MSPVDELAVALLQGLAFGADARPPNAPQEILAIAQRSPGQQQVQLGGQLGGQVGFGLVDRAPRPQQLLAFVAEVLTGGAEELPVPSNRPDQPDRIAHLGDAQNVASVLVVGQQFAKPPQVARRLPFPAVVEVGADRGDQIGAGTLVVAPRLAKEHGRQAAPFILQRLLLLVVVAPCLGQAVVINHLVRILHPLQEGPAPFPVGSLGQLALGQVAVRQPPVLLGAGGLNALAHLQVAQVAEGDAEDVLVLGGAFGQGECGTVQHLAQLRRGIEVALQALLIVVNDVRILGNELLGALLHRPKAGNDGRSQVGQLGRLRRRVVNHAVNVALHEQLEGRQSDVFGALLPRQVQAPGNVGQRRRLNGAEHPVGDRQDHVAGGQRNGAAGVAKAVDDADVGHIDVARLRNEPGDAVRLVVAVGLLPGVSAGRVHEGHDGQALLGRTLQETRRVEMMRRSPCAVLHRSVLGDEADQPRIAVKVHLQRGRVEGPLRHLALHLAKLADHLRRRGAALVLGRGHHGLDVGIDVQALQPLGAAGDGGAAQQPGQGVFAVNAWK